MAKTALELTPAEQIAYRPSAVIEQRKWAGDRLTEERWHYYSKWRQKRRD
jgi:hypothetical protein